MKLPRGVTGQQLVGCLEQLGYQVVRQRGSHDRLRHPGSPAHSISVPLTLHGIWPR
jgi:predicted RNA binding protein YcfA (HicA-like mRNA interferase family)